MKSKSKHTISTDTSEYMFMRGKDGKEHKASIRIRQIYCGKKCRGCPHKAYKYAVYRDGDKRKEVYLGKVKPAKRPKISL